MTNAPTQVDTVADDALGSDDVCGLLDRLARREVSAAELREAATARARMANPGLNAVAWWVDDATHDAPDSATTQPLAGIPTVIKDNEALRGYITTEGSWAVAARPAEAHSPWVQQYLGMGVVPIAKTTLPEFGLTATTESLRFGITRNPWSLGHSCGGSSGGSAALVAAGVVPIAHANDGGGSIRIPASCCGLVGMKPSRGRIIDIPELDDLPVNLVCQGVVTRSVRDTALYFAAAERAHRPAGLAPVGHVTVPDAQRLRIAVVRSATRGLPLSAESVAAVDRAASLCEELGHHVEEIPVPVGDEFGQDFLRYWAFIAFTVKAAGGRLFGPGFDRRRVEPLTSALARLFAREAERVPGSLRRLKRLAQGPDPTFTRFDVVITPTLGKPPVPIGYLGPEIDPQTHLARLLSYTSFTPLQNVTGQPAISLPLGRSAEGLPVGVQCVAARGHERVLLSLALELEQAAPWPTRVGQLPV